MAAAAFGAGCAAVGGLTTGFVLKIIERRGQFHDVGRLEIARSRSSERHHAIRAITIAMAELDHCVEHVAEPRLFEGEQDAYTKRGRKIRLEARFAARTEEDFLGPDLFDDVMAAMEAVERFFQAASEEQPPEQLDALQREWVGRAHLVSDPLKALAQSLSSE